MNTTLPIMGYDDANEDEQAFLMAYAKLRDDQLTPDEKAVKDGVETLWMFGNNPRWYLRAHP